MIYLLNIAVRLMNIAVVLLQPIILRWYSGRWQARGNTFFSVRVDPAFAASDAGRAIMQTFRRRVWIWTALVVLALGVMPGDSFTLSRWGFVALIVAMQGNYFLFHLANRSVRRTAEPVAPPALRRADLSVAEEPGGFALALIEWSGMILPLAVPLATGIVLLLTGGKSGKLAWFNLMPVFYFFLGLLPAQAQYTLRFGARASDWAADPGMSRQYRAYLGLINTLVFGYIILQGCAMLLHPYSSFWISLPGWVLVYFVLFRLRRWLKQHLAESSCDPMADACWKWGLYYFNPDDSALVVPTRIDIGWSPNFARRPVWMGWAVVTITTVVGLSYVFRMTAHSM